MRRILKTAATALMLTSMGGDVLAATANSASCANSEDMLAVRAAAVQQRLMVAAFSCHAIERYNKFVTTYQKDLQASDRALQNFFRRLNGQTGVADYHSFKTRLVPVFLAGQTTAVDDAFSSCQVITANTNNTPRR